MKRTFVAVGVMVTAVLSGGMAHAAWFSTTPGSGNAQATATSVGGGALPTATASGSSVTVSWAASTLVGGAAVSGYQVKRYSAVGDVGQTIGAGCSGTITALRCTETGVAGGTWKYSVTPLHSNWIGTESGRSSSVTVVDNAAPTATITFGANGTSYNEAGFAAGCVPTTNEICGSASDATGVAAVKVAVLRSGSPSRWWNGTAFNATSETFLNATLASTNATSTTWSLPLALSTEADYTVRAQTVDTATPTANTQTTGVYAATSTFTYDTTTATVTGTTVKATASKPQNGTPAKVTVNGDSTNAASPAQVTVVICGTNVFPCASPLQTLTATVEGNGKWSVETTGLTPNTDIYARVTHTDAAGNTGISNIAGPEPVLA